MQNYREVIYDLLTDEKDLKIKESPERGIHVECLTEVYIYNKDDLLELINYSHQQKVVASTKLNTISSRSHSIFMLEINQNFMKNYSKKGTLYLVDLAGSEKVIMNYIFRYQRQVLLGKLLSKQKRLIYL